MKVLQICQKPPYPPIDGGCRASMQLSSEIIKAGYDLQVVSLTTSKHPFIAESYESGYLEKTHFQHVEIDTSIDPFRMTANLFSKYSNWEMRFYSEAFKDMLVQTLQAHHFDYIILDGLMTAVYLDHITSHSEAKLIYRAHNVEWTIPAQMAKETVNPLKKIYLESQAEKLKLFETRVWKKVDCIFSISFRDAKYIMDQLENKSTVLTLPFNVELQEPTKEARKNTIFHLGSMEWKPNTDGILWFISEVWPRVRREIPDVSLHLGGKGIAGKIRSDEANGIHVYHEVENALDFQSSYDVMIVPLKVSSGIRIKVLECMALGKVIVATKKGVDGIACQHEGDVLLADEAEEFGNMVIRALTDRELHDRLSIGAKDLVQKQYHPQRNIDKIVQVFDVMLARQK